MPTIRGTACPGLCNAADKAPGGHIGRRVRTGQVYVNDWNMCAVQLFGGFRQSGPGRESGVEGIQPHFETKLIQGA